ncbi:hypothetical protein QFZ40_001985 [Arthrobacter pascens]|jgi:hypothetical protein|uniref:hypothetical protein n=1 Tax=Arthrobacter pascens TaxID=1677 RepID=UPI002784D892|nr:hypothetical protein [Arthrobacter pascens]MDQ0634076.1 hypothetical protein [Arthrobacter pascens]
MCYSSCEGWQNYRKDAAREAEERRETGSRETREPQVQAEESRMWAYIAQLEERAEMEADRIREKV